MHWILLYDEDCGFCRWSAGVVLRLDRGRRLRAASIQSPEGNELLSPVPPAVRLDAWHLRAPGGDVVSAGAAVAPLFRLLPGGSPVAAVAARFPNAVERSYRWVAGHRTQLGRLIGRRACAVTPNTRAA